MRWFRGLRADVLTLLLCLLALPGCGKQGATVKGKLILPTGMKLTDTDTVKISLVPEEKNASALAGKVSNADQTFTIDGPTKKGVPPGKYKVTVSITPYPGSQVDPTQKAALDSINQAYNQQNTKLAYEVTSDSSQNITIDLAQGSIKKE